MGRNLKEKFHMVKHTKIIFAAIGALYLISILLFAFFLYNTRITPAVHVHMSLSNQVPTGGVWVPAGDIKVLREELAKLNNSNSLPYLLQIFEREREHYVLLTALLFGLTTVVTAFFAVNRLVEKNEFDRINTEILDLETRLKTELWKLRRQSIKFELEKKTNMLRFDASLQFGEQKVNTKELLHLRLEGDIVRVCQQWKDFMPDIVTDLRYSTASYILAWMRWAKRHGYETSVSWNVEESETFRTIMNEFRKQIGKENYRLLVEAIRQTRRHPIELGVLEPE